MENPVPKKPAWLLPVIPLENVTANKSTKEDSRIYVSMYLKARAGSGDSGETYKKRFFLFDDGTPQEWVDVLEDLDELWRQNSVVNGPDRAATVQMILRNDALNEFVTALEEETTGGVATRTTTSSVTAANVTKALEAVTMAVFPHRALETQKNWMRRGMKKPLTMTTRKMAAAVVRLNSLLPRFPGGSNDSKFSESEIVGLLEQAVPARWRAKFDLDGYTPTDDTRTKFVTACEAIERNESTTTATKDVKRTTKKGRGKRDAKPSPAAAPAGTKSYYCSEHGRNTTHQTAQCWTLQNRAKNSSKSKDGTNSKGPSFSRRTFRKEVNAIARAKGAPKRKVLDLYVAAIKAEREKLGRHKQKAKASKPKHAIQSSSESEDSSDSEISLEVIDLVEPPKKKAKTTSPVPAKPGRKTNPVPAQTPADRNAGQTSPPSPTAVALRSIMREPRSQRALRETTPVRKDDVQTTKKRTSFSSSTVDGRTIVKKTVSNKKEQPKPDPQQPKQTPAAARTFKDRISHLGKVATVRQAAKSSMIGRISGSSSSEHESDKSLSE